MPVVLALIIIGVVYGRKQFAYVGLAPGVYIIELVVATMMLVIVGRELVFANARGVGRRYTDLSNLPPTMTFLAAACLCLALAKAVAHLSAGGEPTRFQELPILVYPFFGTVLAVWLAQQHPGTASTLLRVFEYAVLLFPPYYLVLYFLGVIDALLLVDRPLWPNNNYVFVACILAALFFRSTYPSWLLVVTLATALTGVLVEAQRGTFVCLALALVFLVRRASDGAKLLLVGVALLSLVAVFGEQLSYRFEGGVADLTGFFGSVLGGTDDPRYSSTEHRSEMWAHVVGESLADPVQFAVGKPIDEPIVPEAWRNPHNGYVSALGRGGVLALAFYLLLLLDSCRALLHARRFPRHAVVHLIYFAGCVDALTQTVLDSPYSLLIVVIASVFSMHLRARAPSATEVRRQWAYR